MSTRSAREAALTDAVMTIVAEHGLERVSVREVAGAAGVSIGTVQHYFPTKEQMLAAAYTEAVDRIRARVEALPLGSDAGRNLRSVLRQLLPLDESRRAESRVYLAFAAAAATSASLSEIQQATLTELHTALTDAFGRATGEAWPPSRCRLAAHAVIALVDGLALHAVTTGGWIDTAQLTDAVDLVLDGLLVDTAATPSATA
ncbi:TetR/AcrR family transcriptional regulator [Mumia sp. Pv 4-285]|uniref:TetR/AcrR family transcriptional regulator n=1 Tax=Mumia qirimensis TaxID=3234852 RepID=UPI00351D3D6A